MNNKFKTIIIAWLIFGSLIAIFGLARWVLTSPSIANVSVVMQLRRYYYFHLTSLLGQNINGMSFGIIPIQEVKTTGDRFYAYSMFGQFQKINTHDQIIYLKTKDGDVFGFKYSLEPDQELIYTQKDEVAGIVNKSFVYEPLTEGDVILVQWTDTRTLKQILLAASVNEHALVNPELNTNDFILLSKEN